MRAGASAGRRGARLARRPTRTATSSGCATRRRRRPVGRLPPGHSPGRRRGLVARRPRPSGRNGRRPCRRCSALPCPVGDARVQEGAARHRHARRTRRRFAGSAGTADWRRPAPRASSFARRRPAAGTSLPWPRTGELGALYGTFHLLRLMQTGQPIDQAGRHRAAQGAAADDQPLGQPERHDRARLRRPVALEVGRAAGHARSRGTPTTRAPWPRSA